MPHDAETNHIRGTESETSVSPETVGGSGRSFRPENGGRLSAHGGVPVDEAHQVRCSAVASREAPIELPQSLPAVYAELRRIAAWQLEHERPEHTLQPTALAHEAYVRLVACDGVFANRTAFLAMAAGVIRHILIDHARARRTLKRGGPDARRVELDTSMLFASKPELDVLDLHDALERLAGVDARAARVVELRYFGGLTDEEAAAALGVSRTTVQTDWRVARAWLRRALES